ATWQWLRGFQLCFGRSGFADEQSCAADIGAILLLDKLSAVDLEAFPEAVYLTGPGRTSPSTTLEPRYSEVWEPQLGRSEFCGSWKLYWPDGKPMPHSECPMAMALMEQWPIRG